MRAEKESSESASFLALPKMRTEMRAEIKTEMRAKINAVMKSRDSFSKGTSFFFFSFFFFATESRHESRDGEQRNTQQSR